MSDTRDLDSGFPLYEKLVSGKANESYPDQIEEKIGLLTEFKGHVKKELVHSPSIGRYFEALVFVLDTYSAARNIKLVLLAHSSLCYLVKRVVMQSPSFFCELKTVKLIVIHLFMLSSDESYDGKNFWLSSVKGFEALYLLQPTLLTTCMSQLFSNFEEGCSNVRLMKFLLLVDEFLQIAKKSRHSEPGFDDLLLLKLVDIINRYHSGDSEVVKLIHDIISKNFKGQEDEIAQKIENDSVRAIFKGASEQPTFDIEVELERILDTYQMHAKRNDDLVATYNKELTGDNVFTVLESLMLPFQNLKETEQNWKLRQANLIELRKILRHDFVKRNQAAFLSFCREVQLFECIGRAVLSLRTTLSAAACQTYKDLLHQFSHDLDLISLDQMFTTLKNLLSTAKKISSTMAFNCLVFMLINIGFHQKLFQNCLMLINEKSVTSRTCSSVLLRIFLIKYTDSKTLDSCSIYIEEWLKKGITDAQTSVRESMRITFWYYYKGFAPSAKSFLLTQFSSQLRKAIELSLPKYLGIDFPSVKSAASSMYTNSAMQNPYRPGSSHRKYPSYAQPTHSYNASLQRSSNHRSASEYFPNELDPNAFSNRKVSAPTPGVGKRLSVIDQNLNSKFSNRLVAHGDNSIHELRHDSENTIQIDLTNDFSNTNSNSLISKYLNEQENESLETMYQNLNSNSLARVREGLHALQRVLLKYGSSNENLKTNGTIDLSRLKLSIKHVMIRYPLELKSLLSLNAFCRAVPLDFVIELHAVNSITFGEEILRNFNCDLLLEAVLNLLKHLQSISALRKAEKDPDASVHYMKYRHIILNFCFALLITQFSQNPSDGQFEVSTFRDLLLELAALQGQEFDEKLYFDLFNQLYLRDSKALVSTIKSVSSLPAKLKIFEELRKRDKSGTYDIDGIISSQLTTASNSPDNEKSGFESLQDNSNGNTGLVDDQKFMEMTMVNPFNQNRSISGGSVVHYDPNPGDKQIIEQITSTENNQSDGPKLSEITKVISIYERPASISSNPSGVDIEGDTKMSEAMDEKIDDSIGERNDEKMDENSVNLSDIFGHDLKREDHTVKFSDAPPNVINPDTAPPSSRTSEVVGDVMESEFDVSTKASMERDKSPITPLTDAQSKELTEGINSIELGLVPDYSAVNGRASVSSALLVTKMLEVENEDQYSGADFLRRIYKNTLTYWEVLGAIRLIDNTKNEVDNFEQMRKAISRIENGSFTIKHLNYLIGSLALYSHRESMKEWLQNDNGYDELLRLSRMLLTSADQTSLLPLNMASKTIVLTKCVILLGIKLNDVLPLAFSAFEKIWDEVILMLGKLGDYANEIYILLEELRDLLIDLQYFKPKPVAFLLTVLATQTQETGSRIKETFLLETLSKILLKHPLSLQGHQFTEMIQVMMLFIESDCTEWRNASYDVLANVLRHFRNINNGDIEKEFSCLTESQLCLVMRLASH